MGTLRAGQPAETGVYVALRPPDLRFVSGGETRLEGLEGAEYRRFPLWFVIPLAPALGAFFAVAFPVVIFASFLRAIADWIGGTRLHRTGDVVRWGIYLGLTRPSVAVVETSGAVLEGTPRVPYIRLPTFVVVLGCPLLGLLYVTIFPALVTVALAVYLVATLVAALTGRRMDGFLPWSPPFLGGADDRDPNGGEAP